MQRTLIVADIGINHGGSINKTQDMIDACIDAGVDVIKFQTVTADNVYKKDDPLYPIFKGVEFPESHWRTIKAYIESNGKEFLSTPGSKDDVDMLERIGVSRFKIASDSAKNIDFVNYVMNKKKPVIISTGMMELEELFHAMLFDYSQRPQYVLHCVSKYPTKKKEAGLRRISKMIEKIHVGWGWNDIGIGYSDHVPGIEASVAAVARGATLIEKHIKIDNECVDAPVSLTPNEFKTMIRKIRSLEEMI